MDLVGTHKVISEGRTRVWSRVMTGHVLQWGCTSVEKQLMCHINKAQNPLLQQNYQTVKYNVLIYSE